MKLAMELGGGEGGSWGKVHPPCGPDPWLHLNSTGVFPTFPIKEQQYFGMYRFSSETGG